MDGGVNWQSDVDDVFPVFLRQRVHRGAAAHGQLEAFRVRPEVVRELVLGRICGPPWLGNACRAIRRGTRGSRASANPSAAARSPRSARSHPGSRTTDSAAAGSNRRTCWLYPDDHRLVPLHRCLLRRCDDGRSQGARAHRADPPTCDSTSVVSSEPTTPELRRGRVRTRTRSPPSVRKRRSSGTCSADAARRCAR